jgi:hypothetical protein
MIDRSAESSKCPYCGNTDEHKGLRIIFEDKDQKAVRDALAQMHPFDIPDKKKPAEGIDPLSTLIYRYEKCRDPKERLEMVAAGLTEIYGTFTLEDLEKVDEKNAERLLKTMTELCLVYEVRYGRYRT